MFSNQDTSGSPKRKDGKRDMMIKATEATVGEYRKDMKDTDTGA
jgi:hypothetical protein